MRESCEYGSVRGARGNSRPYRVRRRFAAAHESPQGPMRRFAATQYNAHNGGLSGLSADGAGGARKPVAPSRAETRVGQVKTQDQSYAHIAVEKRFEAYGLD